MIVRSPVLTDDCTGDWSDGGAKQGSSLWLCCCIANRIWFMDSFSKIRMVVSDERVEDAVRITAADADPEWTFVIVPDEGKCLVYTDFEKMLREFDPKKPVWVWIEEA